MVNAGSAAGCCARMSASIFSARGTVALHCHHACQIDLGRHEVGVCLREGGEGLARVGGSPGWTVAAVRPGCRRRGVSPSAALTLASASAALSMSPVASAAKNSASPTAGSLGRQLQRMLQVVHGRVGSPIPIRTVASRVCTPTSFGRQRLRLLERLDRVRRRGRSRHRRGPADHRSRHRALPDSATLASVSITWSGRRLANSIRARTLYAARSFGARARYLLRRILRLLDLAQSAP